MWLRSHGLGRSSGRGDGNPLQYSCLERNLAGYIPWSCQELDRTEQLNKHTQSTNILHGYCSVGSNSLPPHAPARLHCPWNFPGKNTGVGYHFFLQGIFLTRDGTCVSRVCCIGREILYHCAIWASPINDKSSIFPPVFLRTHDLKWIRPF